MIDQLNFYPTIPYATPNQIFFADIICLEENLSLLSDEIGIGIRLIQTEASVGTFNVDILAEEENTGRKIIIENQRHFISFIYLILLLELINVLYY